MIIQLILHWTPAGQQHLIGVEVGVVQRLPLGEFAKPGHDRRLLLGRQDVNAGDRCLQRRAERRVADAGWVWI